MNPLTEEDIVHEKGNFWVAREASNKPPAYIVYKTGITHSTPDSGYPLNPDGLSIAIARCDYLAKRAAEKAAEGKKTVDVFPNSKGTITEDAFVHNGVALDRMDVTGPKGGKSVLWRASHKRNALVASWSDSKTAAAK